MEPLSEGVRVNTTQRNVYRVAACEICSPGRPALCPLPLGASATALTVSQTSFHNWSMPPASTCLFWGSAFFPNSSLSPIAGSLKQFILFQKSILVLGFILHKASHGQQPVATPTCTGGLVSGAHTWKQPNAHWQMDQQNGFLPQKTTIPL